MKLNALFLVLCIFLINFINCDYKENDYADYDFNPELLFKAFRQNVTLPTRKPPKKPTSLQTPIKNTTTSSVTASKPSNPIKKPTLSQSPIKNTTTSSVTASKPSNPIKKPTLSQSPIKNTTITTNLDVKPSTPPKKPNLPPKNTTLVDLNAESAPVGVISEQTTPIPVVTTPTPVVTTPTQTNNGRCRCKSGQCSCCTGSVLAAFNQKACLNMTYEPDDFSFTTTMSVNERIVYKNSFSGKNPPPICVRLPRLRAVKVCARFSNIYFSGPNMHTCIDFEANWEDISLFETSFDCIRFGTGGIGVLPPEEGGGANVIDEGDEDIDDYDDSAR